MLGRLHKIHSIVRNFRYPECSAKAIVYKPLIITPKYLRLGDGVNIFSNGVIQGIAQYAGVKYSPKIVSGKGTSIRQNTHITCASFVSIGTYCAITHNVTITDIDHSYEYEPYNYPPRSITN